MPNTKLTEFSRINKNQSVDVAVYAKHKVDTIFKHLQTKNKAGVSNAKKFSKNKFT